MPVIRVRRASDAAPVARAVAAAGLPLVQVALDAPTALDAIAHIADEAPHVIVGAGAVSRPDEPAQARAAGAEFLVATAARADLCTAMRDTELPHLPGAASAAQAAALLDDGYTDLALPLAAGNGGLRLLRALASFVPDARFLVSGGISATDLTGYLAARNVGCVGADWLAPADAVRRREWDRIRRLADAALKLSTPTVAAVRAL